MKTLLVRMLCWCLAGYGGLCLLAFLAQRKMLYFPRRENPSSAKVKAERLSLEPWLDKDGRILGWMARHPMKDPKACLVVLHGNAGSALDRINYPRVFQASNQPLVMDVLLLEYPGYGPRDGSPTEKNLVQATIEALDRLHRVSATPILLAGESLGSAVAALAAAQRPGIVKGLLLITPLKNIPAIARRHYPILPPFLARDTLRADRALAKLRIPTAFLIAEEDEVVFPDLGMEMYHAYQGPKRLWTEPRATHNTLDSSPENPRWKEITRFLAQG